MNALVKVPFYGDTIEAAKNKDGIVYVSVRRICDSLDIDYKTQYRKLQTASWACMVIMPTHDTTGRLQDTCVVDLESLPAWMLKINANKVSPDVRDKLVRYQREAKAVLSAWFLGISTSTVSPG